MTGKKNPLFILAFFGAFLFNCCQSGAQTSEQMTAASENYKANCMSCHGNQLQRFKKLKTYEKPVDYIVNIIKTGNDDKGMPSYDVTFSDEEMREIAEYIKSFDYSKNHIVETTGDEKYSIETIVDDLGIPWGLEFLPNGDLLIGEKDGTLLRFTQGEGLTEITGLPEVRDRGQGGLMDLKIHPDYENNGWLYISYSYIEGGDGGTAIIRAKIKDNKLEDIQELYKATPASGTSRHYGSRIVFDNDGFMYFAIGDRGERDRFPQKLDNSNGKIHRLYDDGRVPDSNPFVGKSNAVESIYSYGHRNPQGLAVHPQTGEVWEHEHGPKGGDEINIIKKGENYGWPVISYGINYNGTTFTDITEKEGMMQPIQYYKPSIAPCGMAFITSDKYPGWENNLLIGSLSFRYLERLELNDDLVVYQEKLLEELGSRVRTVKMSPDGFIYVTVEDPGRVLKLLPKK